MNETFGITGMSIIDLLSSEMYFPNISIIADKDNLPLLMQNYGSSQIILNENFPFPSDSIWFVIC